MATRILGPTGSKKRRRFLLVPMLCIAALALFWIGSAQAVHELGVLQLDGNPWVFAPSGTNASQPNYASRTDAGQLPEDWDLICIKHLNTLTNEPGTCNNDTGYVLPKNYYEKVGAQGFEKKPIGTGPYMVDEYQGNAFLHNPKCQ